MTTASGEKIIIRETQPADAGALLQFLEKVSAESDFLTFGAGEFEMTVAEEEKFLAGIAAQRNSLALIALSQAKVVGSLTFIGGKRKRVEHAGEFGLSVLKEYWQQGIGSALIQSLLVWCKQSGIRKVNLRVREDNLTAIKLYQKFGFREEGRISREFYLNGRFYDSYALGLIID
ncbi:MAG: GNAT family N-acetyltransferase [Firmicutes bacterium]|nr:GNAT family N-acetyltransferase [Bacillota bacterium]